MDKKIEIDIESFKLYHQNHTRKETANYFNVNISKIDTLRKKLCLPRKILKYKETPEFTNEQIEIIIGSLLGDGSLSLVGRNNAKNSKYAEIHSEKQYEYLEWKMNKLKPFSFTIKKSIINGRKIENKKVVNDPTKKLISCRLETIVHPVFTELERKWYLRDNNNQYVLNEAKKRIKILPKDLILTPTIIAIWYFDDGSNSAKTRQAVFNTHSFSKDECYYLINQLKSYDIDCGLVKNRNKLVIQTRTSSYLKLINLVTPKLPCKCMRYKIDLQNYTPPNYSTRFQKKIIV